MRLSQKIVLTFLIAVVITGIFGILAYTGLFGVLETEFFSERVRSDQILKLERISQGVAAWNDDILSRFAGLARDRNFEAVYSPSQRAEEIQSRAQSIDSLGDRLIGFLGLRVVDADGAVQYSSFPADIAGEQLGFRRVYSNWKQLDDSFPLPDTADTGRDTAGKIIYDGQRGRIIYLVPSADRAFVVRGWMVVYMSPLGLTDHLASGGMTAPGGGLEVVSDRGIIVDIRSEQAASVKEAIDRLWPQFADSAAPADFAPLADAAAGERYWLASTRTQDGTWVGKLVPGRLLGFSVLVQVIILTAVFISLTLLVFLVLNLRQDHTEVIRRRVNRLQVNLLRDWLENHEGRKLRTADLESRRAEVKTELRSGLGNLRGTAGKAADAMIDEGWTRITEILAEKDIVSDNKSAAGAQTESRLPVDLKQLEDMITRAVAEVNRTAGAGSRGGLTAAPAPPMSGRPMPGRAVDVVDDADELDDVEPLDEVEELDEVEPLDDADELRTSAVGGNENGKTYQDTKLAGEIQPLDDLQDDEQGLEILEEVEEDSSGELIEIARGGDRGKLYMFEKHDDADITASDNDLEDLEEFDELEELPEYKSSAGESADTSSHGDTAVRFIDIAEVLPASEAESPAVADAANPHDHETSMESLIMTRTTGILPGVDSADDFEFDDEAAILTWSDDGLDYDRYLQGFKKGVTGIYKSLMGLSKQFHAICGVMMAGSQSGMETEYTVGLDDESASRLSVAQDEDVWKQWFSKRQIVFVPDLSSSLYAEKTRHVEYRHVKSGLFIPVLRGGSRSYVFLGFKEAPQDLMSLLAVGEASG